MKQCVRVIEPGITYSIKKITVILKTKIEEMHVMQCRLILCSMLTTAVFNKQGRQ